MKWLGPFWTPELSTKKGNPQEQIEQFPVACVYSWFIYVYMLYYVFAIVAMLNYHNIVILIFGKGMEGGNRVLLRTWMILLCVTLLFWWHWL